MFSRKLIASVMIPSAVVVTEASKSDKNKKEEEENFKCRPSELPIYTPDNKQALQVQNVQTAEPNLIEKSVGSVRVKLFSALDQVKHFKDTTEDYIVDGISGAQWMVDYLGKDSADPTHKAGAIAVGGLAGLIMGLRGGFFRRTLFTSIGALGMASICYPKEAAEYSEIALEEGKNYATIGYNFVYGVKADDPPLELPKIPSSLNEVWDKILGATKQEKSVSEPELPTIQVNDEDVNVAPEPKNESSVPEPQPVPAVEHDVCIPNPEAEIRTISSS